MKTLSTLILACLISMYGLCQTQIASVNKPLNELKTAKVNTTKNILFLSGLDQSVLPEKIIKLHKQIAEFDVMTLNNYDTKDPSLYDVTFTESNIKVKTSYDHEGRLIDCEGRYTDLKLPFSISSEISKKYPGWGFKKTIGNYTFNDGTFVMTYKVVINKDGKSKTLKFDASDYGI